MSLRVEHLPRWLRDILPLLLWLALIFILSDQPVLIDVEEKFGSVVEKIVYKTAHATAYAVLVWLWWRALSPDRRLTWPVLAAAFGCTVLYGVSDEIHQAFVPGRHARFHDVLFDASGALAMIILMRRLRWLRFWPETWPSPPFRRSRAIYANLPEVNRE